MEKYIDAVRKWMIQDRLMINDDKTEFLLVATRQQLDKLDSCSITVGNNHISPSPCVRNLGSWFDSNLSMTDHAARLILGIGKFSHITPALHELHWLPVSLRIDWVLFCTVSSTFGVKTCCFFLMC